MFFIYDVQEYLNTLDYISTLKGKLFIPSHCEATNDISKLIDINRTKIEEITNKIYDLCCDETTFEDLMKKIFDSYNLALNPNQYILGGSTIRSYLSYLYDNDRIEYIFKDNKMYWKNKRLSN